MIVSCSQVRLVQKFTPTLSADVEGFGKRFISILLLKSGKTYSHLTFSLRLLHRSTKWHPEGCGHAVRHQGCKDKGWVYCAIRVHKLSLLLQYVNILTARSRIQVTPSSCVRPTLNVLELNVVLHSSQLFVLKLINNWGEGICENNKSDVKLTTVLA